jgi:hypothetical protein
MDLEKWHTEPDRSVNLILRYIAGGGVFVLALGFLRGNRFSFLSFGEAAEPSWLLASLMVFVSGVALYGLHRSLPYVVILRLLHWCFIKTRGLSETMKVSQLENQLAEKRFNPPSATFQRRLERMAAEVHFLYVAAWALFGSVFVDWVLGTPAFRRAPVVLLIIIAAGLFLVGALNRDRHVMTLEINRLLNEPTRSPASSAEQSCGL